MTNFVDPTVSDFANAVVYQDLTSNRTSYFLQGVFGRGEYSYENRYFLSASYRRDASSRFAPDKRWGGFWSLGLSWNAKQEKFLLPLEAVNYLKFKASYGTQGNDNIGMTKVYEDLYRIDRVNGEASIVKVFRAAPDVTWEKSNNFNARYRVPILRQAFGQCGFLHKGNQGHDLLPRIGPFTGRPCKPARQRYGYEEHRSGI